MLGERNTSSLRFINLEREKRRSQEASVSTSTGVMKFLGRIPISILDRLEGSKYSKNRQKQLGRIRTIFERKDETRGPNVISFNRPPEDSA